MKVRNKISVAVIPIMMASIVAINISFGLFFKNYVKTQENYQVDTLTQSLSAFFRSEKENYLSTVNDWSHWDDTYNFLNGGAPDYVSKNLAKSTFDNLDLSFFILTDNTAGIKYQQYYSTERTFTDFPSGFMDSFGSILSYIGGRDDSYGVMQLGSSCYFVAASEVTDSLAEKGPAGKLIIGRRLDDGVLGTISRITGCTAEGLSIGGFDPGTLPPSPSDTVLYQKTINNVQSAMSLKFVIPNQHDLKTSLSLDLTMQRTVFVSQLKNILTFSICSTVFFAIIAAVIVLLLGRFLSKPADRLVCDVEDLDITNTTIPRLDAPGRDEFAIIRQSFNRLLSEIETYHTQLIESREELHATLVSVGDGVITVDNAGHITFLNPVAQKLTGWSPEAALGEPIENVFRIISEDDGEPLDSPIRAVFEGGAVIELSNHTLLISKDGSELPIENTAAPIRDAGGVTKGCVLVFRDFSEQKEKQRRIEYLSYHDQLTGLYNRRFFEQELRRLNTEKTLPLSFVYADLNGLKIINDAFGHESGDQMIQWVADLFVSECAPGDIVARIGGDEFVMLLPRTGKDGAEALVSRLKTKADTKKYRDIDLSISFGWDTKEELKQSALDVMKNAEDLMYRKKILNNTSKRGSVIKSILNTLLIKYPREEAHSQRVRDLCESIGAAYGLKDDDLKELVVSGELHDIGKIAIDEVILNKKTILTEREWLQIRHHPETGYRLLGSTGEFSSIAEYVLSHHERWDGKGYPRGLKGTDIEWKARVIAVADAYDAMTSDRPYRKALSPETAADEIRAGAGTQFDPDIARVFVEKVLHLSW